jgi:hypothetical protein
MANGLPDPKKIESRRVVIKNTAYGGVRGLRKWEQMHPKDSPRMGQEKSKDTGVVKASRISDNDRIKRDGYAGTKPPPAMQGTKIGKIPGKGYSGPNVAKV